MSPVSPRSRRVIRESVLAVVLGLAAAALMWHRLGPVTRNTAWAEDSGRFLQDRLVLGPVRSVWQVYDGYLHLVPRTLTDLAVAVQPIDRYAVTVAGLSCLVLGAVAALVFVLAADVVPQWPLRALLALVPAFVPLGPFEIAGNTANLHWYLLFLAPWVFAWRSRTWWGAAGLAVVAGFVTGTEIQSAVFLPLLLLGIRRARTIPVAAVAVLGIAAQVVSTVTHPRLPDPNPRSSPLDMVEGYLAQPFGGSWTADVHAVAQTVLDHGWAVLAVPAVVAAVVGVVAIVVAPWRVRLLVVALAGGSVVVWVAALVVNSDPRTLWSSLTPESFVANPALRYAAASSMFLLAAAVVGASALVARGRIVLPVVGWLVIAVVVAAGVTNAAPGTTRRSAGPSWYDEVRAAQPFCRAHPHASASIAAQPLSTEWVASIPCERILGR